MFTIFPRIIVAATFLRAHLTSEKVSYRSWQKKYSNLKARCYINRGGSRDFEKRWRSMSAAFGRRRKFLSFRWSKKAKITLETISFGKNISIRIFKFSPFLYAMKSCQFFKICKHFAKEREKTLGYLIRKTEISWALFYNRLLYKVL